MNRLEDNQEKDLMESIENEEWKSVDDLDQEINKAREAAAATFRKTERMNIRVSYKDLRDLKVRARQEGMPYQTLASSLIHKYLSGRLFEKDHT